MKFGHRLKGIVQAYDEKGRGTFEIPVTQDNELRTVAVPFSAVGDDVTAVFMHRDRGVKIAKLESITTPSPDRVATPCPHAGICGGCLWQHLRYDAQLALKRDMINGALKKADHTERIEKVIPSEFITPPAPLILRGESSSPDISSDLPLSVRGIEGVTPAVPINEPSPFYYRNRMDYAVGWNGEIGLKEYGSWNRYVNVKTCLLLHDDVGIILEQVREWMKAYDLQPWDAKFYTGDIRYVVIREGKQTNDRLIVVVVKDFAKITEEHRTDLIARLGDHATSLLLGEQSKTTDLSLAQQFETLKGNPWFEEIANDMRYRIHPNSFFQTNTLMAEKLQRYVGDAVGAHGMRPDRPAETTDRPVKTFDRPTETTDRPEGAYHAPLPKTVLDLYCGLGFFGIYLAKRFPDIHVSGFEIDAEAIELAKYNAKTNGVAEHCDFTSGPAEDLSWKEIDADVIILDPPRSGLHPKVLKTILEKKPQTIIYVSCNYHRLVEEMKELKKVYDVETLNAFDLFPQTPHVEVVVKFQRRNSL